MNSKIILYGVFYFILTSFFLYLLIKEKKIAEKFSIYRERYSNKLADKLKIEDESKRKKFKKVISVIENLVVAICLVLVIQRFYIGNFVIPTGSMIPTIEIKDRLFADMVSYKFRLPKREEIIVFKEPIQDKVLYTKRAMALPGEKVAIRNNTLYINDVAIESRNYSNLGIENAEWIVPKKGDKLVILPAGNYTEVYKSYNIDIAKIQSDLKNYPSEIKTILPNLKFLVNGEETGLILDFIHNDEIINKILRGEKIEIVLEDDYILALGDNTDHSFDSRMWGFVASKRIRGRGIIRFWPLNRIGFLKW